MSEEEKINPSEQNAAQELYSQMKEAEKNKNFDLAVELCERIVNEFDHFAAKMMVLAQLYCEAGYYEKAIQFVTDWENELRAKNETATFNLVMPQQMYWKVHALKQLGRTQDALAAAETAVIVSQNVLSIVKENTGGNGNYAMQEFPLALVLAEVGEIYYEQKNYEKAGDYFIKSADVRPTFKTLYYLGCLLLNGLGGTRKNVEIAENYFIQCSSGTIEELQEDATSNDIEIIGKACFMLGEIYSTENGFKDKEKAYQQYQKAKALGYDISDEEIQQKIENIQNSTSSNKSNAKKAGGCYVATCVYGSYDCPEVWTLRRFRDSVLSKNLFGKMFIWIYYAVSPTAVRWFGDFVWFHKLFKSPLDKLVSHLQNKGIENTPYQD